MLAELLLGLARLAAAGLARGGLFALRLALFLALCLLAFGLSAGHAVLDVAARVADWLDRRALPVVLRAIDDARPWG